MNNNDNNYNNNNNKSNKQNLARNDFLMAKKRKPLK